MPIRRKLATGQRKTGLRGLLPALVPIAAVAAVTALTTASPALASARPGGPAAGAAASGSVQRALTAAYAAYRHIPVRDIAGIQSGTLHVTTRTLAGHRWATADFLPALTDPQRVLDGFQDGAGAVVFTNIYGDIYGDGQQDIYGDSWRVRQTVGMHPLSCPGVLPASVRLAWHLTSTARCATSASPPGAQRPVPAAIKPAAVSTSTIVSVAERNDNHGDTPASDDFSFDCDPYSTLVHAGGPTSGCGTDSTFNVQDENEEWCADFAKYVWEQGGVTADLGTLTASAATFYKWGQEQGESMPVDSTSPQLGDAVVFYPADDALDGDFADHVGIIVGVNSDGTVNLVDGDFGGSGVDIKVEEDNDVSLASWSAGVWKHTEKWVFVSPGQQSTVPGQTATLQSSSTVTFGSQMQVFGRGTGGNVYSDVYSTSTAKWSGWQDIGGDLSNDPTAIQYGAQMQVFGRTSSGATDQDVWSESTGKWSGWVSLGGTLAADPVAIEYNTSQYGDQVELYGITSGGGAWSDVWTPSTGKWSGWYSLGGTNLTGTPSVAVYGSQMEVFARDTSGATWSDVYTPATGKWSGFQNLGGSIASDPAALEYQTSQHGNQMEVYGVTSGGGVWSDVWTPSTGKWSGWITEGNENFAGNVSIVQYGTQMQIFGRSTAGTTYSDVYTPSEGKWSGWQNLGGTLSSNVSAIEYDSPTNGDQMELYGRASGGATWSDVWTPENGAWSGWYSLGGNLVN
jgi:hypothetical protein